MSFPGQCWLGIFLGYQKSQTFFNKASIIKKEQGCISYHEFILHLWEFYASRTQDAEVTKSLEIIQFYML